jgi:uncharacterized protein YndB with AHSA1/START domain
MRMKPGIHVTRRYSASPERVFDAWLDPDTAGRWLFATASRPMARATIDARVGGLFCFTEQHDGLGIEYRGRYVEIIPPRRLVFTLSMYRQFLESTCVVVEIAPLNTGCELNVFHEDVPPHHASRTEGRWTGILYGLGMTLEASAAGIRADGRSRRMRPLSKSGPGYRL